MRDKIVSFMLYLGENQWDDGYTLNGTRFKPTLTTDKKVMHEVCEYAVECGFNTVFLATVDGVKYKSHPEIAVDGAWEVEELIEELKWMRSIGLTPIPELNFSAGHDAWLGEYSRMVSSPTYYEVVRDLIHELIDIFDKPELFMIDFDEENVLVQRRMQFVCYRQYDLLWHDLAYIHECIREKGVRPWMYVDEFVNNPEKFLEYVKKDVVVSPWFYGIYYEDVEFKFLKPNDPEDPDHYNEFCLGKVKSYTDLPKLGYDIIPVASNCCRDFSIDQVVRYIEENVPKKHLLGIGIAPWIGTNEAGKYVIMDHLYKTKIAMEKHCKGGKF